MPAQIRQTRLSGLFQYNANRTEIEKAWTEREETRTAVRGALAVGSSFRAFWKACKNLREIIQAVGKVYVCELEEFIKLGT